MVLTIKFPTDLNFPVCIIPTLQVNELKLYDLNKLLKVEKRCVKLVNVQYEEVLICIKQTQLN